MVTFTQVLYPTDLSEAARPAARYAAAIARWYGARLTVLHVVPTFEPIPIPSDRTGAATTLVQPPARDSVEADVRRALSADDPWALPGVGATRRAGVSGVRATRW